LEEDLQIAPDFFEYFTAIAPLLDSDDTLLAASAWNDNGIKGMVKDKEALYRSDFFPGLGWMMPK
jgi:alpha-1,3-mannosyl-glycoprotein beta-1,2-N-acetylglucosaminyltransferase